MRYHGRAGCPLLATALLGAALLSGCGVGAGADSPQFTPKASFSGEGGPPVELPTPERPPGTGPPSGSPGNPSSPPSGSPTQTQDPSVVAKRLTTPIGIAILPDNTALVAERRTGRIVHVQKQAGQPVQVVRTLTGLDATGDGGLLDIALSPTYLQDHLILAFITTATDNRVVHFTAGGPVTPILTGIPKGASGNTGRLAFDESGRLYIGTGDAGRPALAPNPKSLAGKVLRVDDIGRPQPDNPDPASPVYTSGHHTVDGLCIDPATGVVFDVEAATSTTGTTVDEVNKLVPGKDYGWGSSTGGQPAVTTVPATHPGPTGCTVQARGFFVSTLAGQALLASALTGVRQSVRPGDFTIGLDKTYGRLRNVVAAGDGALWLTTSNKDGKGTPIADDERVLRILPATVGGNSPL